MINLALFLTLVVGAVWGLAAVFGWFNDRADRREAEQEKRA